MITAFGRYQQRLGAGVAAAVVLVGCAGCAASQIQGHDHRSAAAPRPHHVVSSVALRGLVANVPCPPSRTAAPASRAQLRAFDPVAVMTCSQAEKRYRDGEWTVSIRKASARGIAGLRRAFERPDRVDPQTTICADVLVIGAPVLFVNSRGHVLIARYPLERPCDQPLAGVMQAVAHHAWTVVSIRKVRQQFTPAELAAGCEPDMKNMVSIDAQFGIKQSRGGPAFTHAPVGTLDACIFRASRKDPQVGTFVRGIRFNAHQSSQISAALTGAGHPGPCPTIRAFAYITVRNDTDGVFLELGGCWRLQRDQAHITLGSATHPALLGRLLGTNHVP